MKKLIIFVFVSLLLVSSSCQKDKIDFPIGTPTSLGIESINKVKNIGVDVDFIQYINASKELALLLYFNRSKSYNKYDLKNPFAKIKESQKRAEGYLRNGLTKDELPLLLKEYGSSEKEVRNLVGRMTLHILLLNHKYGEQVLEKFTSDEFNQAYNYALAQQPEPMSTGYCVQCPGANCENCGPGQNPDEDGGWNGNGGDGGDNGGGGNCIRVRQVAARKRDNTINNAWREFAAESVTCAGAAGKTAVELYGATWYLNALGPEAPFVVATLGTLGVGTGCMWLAAGRLDSNLQIAQSDYQLDVMGQGCNP